MKRYPLKNAEAYGLPYHFDFYSTDPNDLSLLGQLFPFLDKLERVREYEKFVDEHIRSLPVRRLLLEPLAYFAEARTLAPGVTDWEKVREHHKLRTGRRLTPRDRFDDHLISAVMNWIYGPGKEIGTGLDEPLSVAAGINNPRAFALDFLLLTGLRVNNYVNA